MCDIYLTWSFIRRLILTKFDPRETFTLDQVAQSLPPHLSQRSVKSGIIRALLTGDIVHRGDGLALSDEEILRSYDPSR